MSTLAIGESVRWKRKTAETYAYERAKALGITVTLRRRNEEGFVTIYRVS